MTRLLLTLVLARHMIASSAVAGTLQEELIQLERESWIAWQKHDGSFFEGFLADDHVEVHSNGVVTGKAGVVAHVASKACVVSSFSLEEFRFTQFDEDTALITYRATQDTDCGGFHVPSPVWVSSLFVRRDATWKNALYVHTPIIRP